jgi:TonB-linked SusC/RagA family outer membrane protein
MIKLNKAISLLSCCFFLFTVSAFAQQITVKGRVTDAKSGEALPGVTVRVLKSSNGTTTDAEGRWSLNVSPEATLEFSFIGYNSRIVKVDNRKEVNIQIFPSAQSLATAVIIGHQVTTQRLTTAAVTTVTGKEIENLPSPSFTNLLQGKVAGVNIQNYSGEPGVRNTFVVRGNTNLVSPTLMANNSNLAEAQALSSPLFVIDGVPTNLDDISTFDNTGTNILAGINVNDIASIQVEKDAAATAAWGSRGANGVVIITTKRGNSPTPHFSVNYYTGITEKPAALPTVIGAAERTQKMNLLYAYGNYQQLGGWDKNTGQYIMHNGIPQMLTDSLNPSFNNAMDWQGLFYRVGVVHNVDASVSAANKLLAYRVSGNYYDQDGVIIGTGFTRYTLRGNFDFTISKKVSAQLSTTVARLDRKRGIGSSPYGSPFPLDEANLPSSFYKLDKTDSQYYKGSFTQMRDKNQNDSYMGYLTVNYDIIPGLRYSLQGSVSSQLNRRDQFIPSTILVAYGQNYGESDNSTYNQYNLNNIFSYTKTFNNVHHLAVTATQSFQKEETFYTAASGYNLPSDVVQTLSGVPQQYTYGIGGYGNNYSDYQVSSLLSYIGQLQYDYKEKYVLAAVWRADASSRFGKDTKWGYFPSISGAWLVSEEPFMKSVAGNWMDLFKLRASWGRSGRQPNAFYGPFNSYNLGAGFYNGVTAVTPSYTNGITLDSLTWATTTQWDFGTDIYLFDSRLDLSVDYYDKQTHNDFFTFQFPFYVGYTSQTSNAPLGIKNNGVEVNLTTHNFPATHEFQWNTNFNISYNHNIITSLPNGNQSFIGNSYAANGLGQDYIFTVGQPLYEIAQVVYQGVYNNASQIPINPATGGHITYFKGNVAVEPGMPIWKDVNKRYDVWMGDVVPTGDPNPKFTGGFNNDFSYKHFTLSIDCNFTLGRTIINDALANQFASAFGNFYSPTNAPSRLVSFAETRLPDLSKIHYWLPQQAAKFPNTYQANFQSLSLYSSYFYQYNTETSEFNENGDYFRLQTIALGYQLPDNLLNKLKVQMIKVYGVLDNVWIWQKASVPDAEQVDPFGQYTGDRYPIPRVWTLGATIQF